LQSLIRGSLALFCLATGLPTALLSDPRDTERILAKFFAERDPAKRAMVAWTMSDEVVLQQIVKKDKDSAVRRAAVENPSFRDQSVLAEVATWEPKDKDDDWAQSAASNKLVDPSVLVKTVLMLDHTWHPGSLSNSHFIDKISDQRALAELVRDLQGNIDRAHVVAKLTDSTLLARLAKTGRADSTRGGLNQDDDSISVEVMAAAARNPHLADQRVLADLIARETSPILIAATLQNPNFTDEEALLRFAGSQQYWMVRAAAVRNPALRDAQTLTAIATMVTNQSDFDPNDVVRESAASNLNLKDQGVLLRLATADKNRNVRRAAILNASFTDQSVLTEIAKHEKEGWIREAAVTRLTDEKTLSDLAHNDPSPEMRVVAIKNSNLADLKVIAEIAKGSELNAVINDTITLGGRAIVSATITSVRIAALDRLKDAALLLEIGKNDMNCIIRSAAIKTSYFIDTTALVLLAQSDACKDARLAAVEKLADARALRDVIDHGRFVDSRHIAIWKLNDPNVLQDIAKRAKDAWVRDAAINRLSKLHG
jgi:hypothetical protein